MSGRIIQFGTSRFLQAHVDLFVHEARQAGQAVGPICIVQASGAADRAGRVAAFGRPGGYPVIIRGIEKGERIERRIDVTSVDRGLSAAQDWQALSDLFAKDADIIVSNTADAGYEIAASDRGPALLAGGVPVSFPGKLTTLLHRRWRQSGRGLTVLPCELINRNGRVLSAAVAALAREAGAPEAFLAWLEAEVIFADTLVDRIVSQALEPIGAVAEPYALWVIERRPGLELPFTHPSVVLADDLEPFERLKLHILNLGHTVLADIWRSERRDPGETVREILADADVRGRLDDVYRHEVLPGFAAHGMGEEAQRYVATTLERFLNPFLDHRIADIAQNHATKVDRRITAFLSWWAEAGAVGATPTLDVVIARRQFQPQTERSEA
ncbi:mannitol dehydrogenase family protein [Xanthobacter versatilis]|uniref:mannitol dehydrogenase family protein n=1 Tax=Xanthobacter autotrophicus (strain ATCC BAA-1158 / Py2) TaxID=78245 RepID=UPI00372B1A20